MTTKTPFSDAKERTFIVDSMTQNGVFMKPSHLNIPYIARGHFVEGVHHTVSYIIHGALEYIKLSDTIYKSISHMTILASMIKPDNINKVN